MKHLDSLVVICVSTILLTVTYVVQGAPYLPPCSTGDLFNPDDGKCYPESQIGPCPETLAFAYDDVGSRYYSQQRGQRLAVGKCECAMARSQHPCRHLPVLYSDTFDRCYEIYSQGPCTIGEWYTPIKFVEENITFFQGVCTPNPCIGLDLQPRSPPANNSGSNRWYLHKNKCFKTGTRGHCLDPRHVAYFADNQMAPYCGDFHAVHGVCAKSEAFQCDRGDLFHEETGDCYPEGSKESCPDTMALNYRDIDRQKSYRLQYGDNIKFGQCDCQLSEPRNNCTSRPYLYSKTAQRCFPAFSQGPCGPLEWFRPYPLEVDHLEIRTHLREGYCARNDCLSPGSRPYNATLAATYGSSIFYFGIGDGQCYLTGTTAFCKEADEVAAFIHHHHYPICVKIEIFYPNCSAGAIRSSTSASIPGCPPEQVMKGGVCAILAEL